MCGGLRLGHAVLIADLAAWRSRPSTHVMRCLTNPRNEVEKWRHGKQAVLVVMTRRIGRTDVYDGYISNPVFAVLGNDDGRTWEERQSDLDDWAAIEAASLSDSDV